MNASCRAGSVAIGLLLGGLGVAVAGSCTINGKPFDAKYAVAPSPSQVGGGANMLYVNIYEKAPKGEAEKKETCRYVGSPAPFAWRDPHDPTSARMLSMLFEDKTRIDASCTN